MAILRTIVKMLGKFFGAGLITAAIGVAIGLEIVHWQRPQLTDRSFFLLYWRPMLITAAFLIAGGIVWIVADWADDIPDWRGRTEEERLRQAENRMRVEREEGER